MKIFSSRQVADSGSDDLKPTTCTEPRRSIENRKFAGLVTLLLMFCFSSLSAQQENKELQKVIEAAKKEGKAKLGLTMRWQESGKPSGQKIVETFQARYSFVKIEYERVGGSRERERVLTELAAGKVPYDVTVLSGTQVPILVKANLAEPVDWRALGVHSRHIHPDRFGVYYRSQIVGILYNRKLIPDAVGSKLTWEDCARLLCGACDAFRARTQSLHRRFCEGGLGA